MKYSLECKVVSNILLQKTVVISMFGKEYQFLPDEKGILSKIKIAKTINSPESFYSVIKDADKDSLMSITINEDTLIRQEIISDFQYLEGHLGFIANLTNVLWNEPTTEWIPENDEERKKLNVFSAHFERVPSIEPTLINYDILKEVIETKRQKDNLTVLMSLYRQGKVFFDRREYINAFYELYFILEDLYGEGKWHNWQIKNSFKSSTELRETISWALTRVIESDNKNKNELLKLLKDEGLEYTVEGMIELLVEMRGHLHHFSRQNTSQQKPNPLSQQNYESLAFLTMCIAMQSISKEMKKSERMN